ncbi:PACE efflux transporter [Aquicoccus sp. G2-2]|uniref:PACE efflux transporter n=1 Tax=Aquicoccus sp. G2-2 TaxID=3092120 RepID=UPI002ADFCAF3|nr:PACE efflux transporter [Aquicoccus sp. G2-2]MEA1113987.1 PACE efflux transporter [Aquicoccus sp. G2-2]
MRSTRSRIFHAIAFEVIGLVLLALIGTWALGRPMEEIGMLAVVGATVAMLWTYVYNLMFDRALQRLTGALRKPVWLRIVHSLLFEAGLLVLLLPYIMWHLGVTFIEALLLDLSMALFYVVYAFWFNLLYDRLFPVGPVRPIRADSRRSDNCG